MAKLDHFEQNLNKIQHTYNSALIGMYDRDNRFYNITTFMKLLEVIFVKNRDIILV